MSFFLALDAGGTKTDYVLADETRELARVRTGISMTQVTRTCVGTAGETVPLVKDWLRESISARVGGGLLILGDVEIALEAAFPGRAGVLVMAGTGSNVVGRTIAGELISA